jgi:hypothetical protein
MVISPTSAIFNIHHNLATNTLFVVTSFTIRYPELHLIRQYLTNLPLLHQDLEVPLFFVNEVPNPYCREYEGQDCSSYSNRVHKTLYYVSGGEIP